MRLVNNYGGVIDADAAAGLNIVADTLAVSANSANFTDYNDGVMEATAGGAAASSLGLLTFGAGQFSNAGEILAGKQGEVLLNGAQIAAGGGEVSVAAGGKLVLETGARVSGQTGLTVATGGVVSTACDGSSDAIQTQIYLSGTLDIAARSNLLASTQWVGTGVVNLGATTGAASVTVAAGANLDLWGADTFNLLNAGDQILSAGAGSLFRNRDVATLIGAGPIGDANLLVQNSTGGTVDATGALTLGFSASAPQIQNAGLMEATGKSVLTLAGVVNNTGEIVAHIGAKIIARQAIDNGGREILEGGTLEIVASTSNVTVFQSGTQSSLVFDNLAGNIAPVSGFAAGDTIDERNFAFGDGKFTLVDTPGITEFYALFQNSLGQTSPGLSLLGDYQAAAGSFFFSKDSVGGTVVHWAAKA